MDPKQLVGLRREDRLRAIAQPDGMAAAALIASQRRGGNDHRFVLGGLRLQADRILLMAVEMGPALNIIRPIRLTAVPSLFYRWGTKQAASQFRGRWGLDDLHVYNLDWCDVLALEVSQ